MNLSNIKFTEIFKIMLLAIFALMVATSIILFSFDLAEKLKNKNELNELTKEKIRLEIKIRKYQLNKMKQ